MRPLVEIRCREPGRRDDRPDLESRMMEGLVERRKHSADIDRDRDDRERDDAEISLQLTHLQDFFGPFSEDKEVSVEVHAEHNDEHRNDALHQARVARAAVISHAEASGTGASEGNAECVEQGHSHNKENDNLHDGDSQVDAVQYFGSFLHAGHELAHSRARALCAHEVHVVAARHGKHGQDKDDDAHAADPVRKASPEQSRVAERLYVGENTRSGGRKARYRLKERVGEARNVLCDDQRDRSQYRQDDPAQSHDDQSFSRVVGLTAELEGRDQSAQGKIYHCQNNIDDRLLLPVDQSADGGQYQKSADKLYDNAQYFTDNGIVHSRLLSVT